MSASAQTMKIALRLGLFALFCTLILAIVNEVSQKKIEDNINQLKTAKLAETLPMDIAYDNQLADSVIGFSGEIEKQAKEAGIRQVYVATHSGEVKAVIVDAIAPNGYGGKINLLVGILADGTISGVRVVSHKETAGLGDYIDASKSTWSEQFVGMPVDTIGKRLSLKKEGGQIEHRAGATISARAVTKTVDQAAAFYLKNKANLKVTP